MRQVGHIIRKEVLEHLLSSRSVLTAALCLALIASSALLMTGDYAARRAGYDHRDRAGQTQAGKRPKLTREPSPLSVLARGLDPEMGRLLFITWAQPRRDPGARALDAGDRNLLPSLFEPFDLVHIVGYALSLLALFFSFDGICGEKSAGTLRLTLSCGGSRTGVLLGKWVGGQVSLFACLLPAVLTLFAVLSLSPALRLGGEAWGRVGLLLIASLLFLSTFFSLGLLVSARAHRPATALQVVLFLWAVWVLGAPNLGILAAKTLRPVPSALDVEREKGGIDRRAYATELDYFRACWGLDDAYIGRVVAQSDLAQNLSRPSPLSSYLYAATTLAWTGVPDAHRFRDEVIRWDRRQRGQGYHWEGDIPFFPKRMALDETLRAVWVDLGLLALLNALFLGAAWASFQRYDVR